MKYLNHQTKVVNNHQTSFVPVKYSCILITIREDYCFEISIRGHTVIAPPARLCCHQLPRPGPGPVCLWSPSRDLGGDQSSRLFCTNCFILTAACSQSNIYNHNNKMHITKYVALVLSFYEVSKHIFKIRRNIQQEINVYSSLFMKLDTERIYWVKTTSCV